MAFKDADITIIPSTGGGPALILVNDSYSEGVRDGAVYNTINAQNYWNQGVALPPDTDVHRDLAGQDQYAAVIAAIKGGRGRPPDGNVDDAGTVVGALLMAIGNAASGNTAANRTGKPAPVVGLGVDDDDRPAQTIRGVTGQVRPFGSIKVHT